VQTPTAEVPATPVVQQMDALRKGEAVATFAARHGLELGDLLALNPSIDSLTIRRARSSASASAYRAASL
jgi:hypothetical protein